MNKLKKMAREQGYKKIIKEDTAKRIYDTDEATPTHPLGGLYETIPCIAYGIEEENKKIYIYQRSCPGGCPLQKRAEITEITKDILLELKDKKVFYDVWNVFKKLDIEKVTTAWDYIALM